jgi:T-complex protein 1 subunit eta
MDSIHIVAIPSGSLTDSFLVDGVVFQRTFTYAGFEQQPKIVHNPKILLLNHEIELKHQKEFAHLSINTPNDYASFIDTEWDLVYRKLDQIYDSQCTVVLDAQVCFTYCLTF